MNVIWSSFVAAVYLELVFCNVVLEITSGTIEGKIMKSRGERTYYSYTGIPYAKPPIGELRFKSPERVEPWNGTLDATKEANICLQHNSKESQEDCLYLNVYTPKTDKKLLPIMFWIHGGAFSKGHSRSDLYGPDYFMDMDVVIVTINYRLGILGFLSTEDDVLPGNYGMKDQVQALRWVQENIVQFNGDPNRVTIFGGSVGAASVGFHLLSPMSKGLFHKAILQSGVPVCEWAVNPIGMSRKRAHSVAIISGCLFNNSEDVLNCLKKIPAQYFVDVHTKLYSWLKYPAILFNPVVENCNNSDGEAFLCHHPIYDFKQESFVPVIIGLNSAEGGMFVSDLYNDSSLKYPEFRAHFNRLFSITAWYNLYTKPDRIDEVGEKLLTKYFPSGDIKDNSHSDAVDLFTDAIFSHCIINMTNRLSSPVYTYLYDYQNDFSYNKLYGTCKKPLGVTHGDENISLFKMVSLYPNDLNANDLEVSQLLTKTWYKFATSKKPTIDGSKNGLAWPRFTQSNQSMVHFNSNHPEIIQNPFKDAYEFWHQL